MERKLILSGFLSSLLLVSVIAYSLPAFAQGSDSAGQSQVEYAFGKIPGKDIIVHVAVVVPPGLDKNDIINQALNYQGAKKIEKSEFSLTGLEWDQFVNGNIGTGVKLNYNPADEKDDTDGILNAVMSTWNGVDGSSFVFINNGTTTTCPSLVKECGNQNFDGKNDFGWVNIKQPHTLGVTYYHTTIDEIDVALTTNKRISWTTYDAHSVVLHELGHALGLGHSEVNDAVMYASYQGVRQTLHDDDVCGVLELYSTSGCTVNNNPPPPPETGAADLATVTYNGKGGKLQVNVKLTADGSAVTNTSVTIIMERDGNPVTDPLTKTTNDSGEVKWNFIRVSSGNYETNITHVGGSVWNNDNTVDLGYTR